MTRSAFYRLMYRAGRELMADERELLGRQAERMMKGQRQYGVLRLDTDTRDFVEEGLQEVLDLANYMGARLIQLSRRRGGGGHDAGGK